MQRPKPMWVVAYVLLFVVSTAVVLFWSLVALTVYTEPLGELNRAPSDVRHRADAQFALFWIGTVCVMAANFPAWIRRWRVWLATEIAAGWLFVAWLLAAEPLL